MKINIKNIGQLKEFTFKSERRINIVHAENGTGKTTFSRLLASINKSHDNDLIKTYCNPGNKAEILLGKSSNLFEDGLWKKEWNNFYIFNADYYSDSIVTRLGEQMYIGESSDNRVRRYLECWKMISLINQAHDVTSLFTFLANHCNILDFIDKKLATTLFDWFRRCANVASSRKLDVQAYYRHAKQTFDSIIKGVTQHSIVTLKIINFANNAFFRHGSKLGNLALDDYEGLMYTRPNNRILNEKITIWVFWKLALIYALKSHLDDQYEFLPFALRDRFDLLRGFGDLELLDKIKQSFSAPEIADDILNDLLQAIGLGFKYKIINGTIVHRFYKDKIKTISNAENRLLSLCYFLSEINKHVKNDANYYVVIDDPITSMDHNYATNIVRIITHLIQSSRYDRLNWLIMTHNAAFCDQLMFRLYRDDLHRNTSMYLWYLDRHLSTVSKTYHRQFETVMKRIIVDILGMSQNPSQHSLVDICNKVRILLEIYCGVYAGSLNFNLLFADRDCFSIEEKSSFQGIIDMLNRYSHGDIDYINNAEPLLGNVNKILSFAVKLIQIYSPKIWEKL